MGLIMNFLLIIDTAIYVMISWMYNLIISATALEILSADQIKTFTNNIYAFIGIVMLFFVAYKIIYFIVSPDSSTDKNTGFGKLTTRIFVAILLTVAIPFIFDFGMRLQSAIISENLIGKIIYGSNSAKTSTKYQQNIFGNVVKTYENTNAWDKVSKDNLLGGRFSAVLADFTGSLSAGARGFFGTGMTEGERFSKLIWSGFVIVTKGNLSQNDVSGYIMDDRFQLTSMRLFIMQPLDNIPVLGELLKLMFDQIWYIPIVPTIAGGWCLYMLAMMFFDVIMRVIKLTFLQILSPIFIASYVVDDKQKMFTSWWKTVGGQYIMLFVRLFVIQVVMWMIAQISIGLMDTGLMTKTVKATYTNMTRESFLISLLIIRLTLIFALLYFAKIAPKWLGDVFDIKANSDAKEALKSAWEDTKKAVSTVAGIGAAVATGGAAVAALPSLAQAGGVAAAQAGGNVALGKLKGAAVGAGRGLSAVGVSFKTAKGEGLFGSKRAGIKAGTEELETSAVSSTKTMDELRADSRKAALGEEAREKAAIKKTVDAEEKTRQAVFYDSKKNTEHAFAGMSSQQQAAILGDADVENKILELKRAAAAATVFQNGGAQLNPADFNAAVESVMKKITDSDVVKTDQFKTEFEAMVTSKQGALNNARQEILQSNATLNQYVTQRVEQETIITNNPNNPAVQATAQATLARINQTIDNLTQTIVDNESIKNKTESQLNNWGKS